MQVTFNEQQLSRFVAVGNEVADAAGQVIREYFRSKFDILDKDDLSKWWGGNLVINLVSNPFSIR